MKHELDGKSQEIGMNGVEANMIQIEEGAGKILLTAESGKGKPWFKRKVDVFKSRLNVLIAIDPSGEQSELVARIKN